MPKGGRERTVDLPASAVAALKAHRHLRGRYVFCQEDGQPLAEDKMKQPLRRALNRAGISREEGRIGWHANARACGRGNVFDWGGDAPTPSVEV